MPLFTTEHAGTERDGTQSTTYCIHCYQQGAFTEPELTKEVMIKKCAPFLVEQFGVPAEKAEEMVKVYISTLSKWK